MNEFVSFLIVSGFFGAALAVVTLFAWFAYAMERRDERWLVDEAREANGRNAE